MRKIKSKHLTSVILAASIILSLSGLTGCGSKSKEEDTQETTEATESEITATDATESDATEQTSDDVFSYQFSDELSVYAAEDPSTPEALDEQARFEQYLDDSFKESVVCDTLTLHYTLADPSSYGIDAPEPTFGDSGVSDEDIANDKQESIADLDELHEFNYDLLTSEQKFTYDILDDYLQTNLMFYDYIDLYEPFAYTSGLHSNLPVTMSEYTFYTTKDVDDYLALLAQVPEVFQIYLDFEVEKSQNGYFMNDSNANEVIRQCTEYIANPEQNLLIETFDARIADVPGITDEEIETYKQANHDAVINSVIPAYENVINTFKALKGTCVNEMGLAHFENGTEYYKYLIKNKVGSDKSPEEIISLLETEIDNVMSEMYDVVLPNYAAYESYMEEAGDIYTDVDLYDTIRYFETAFEDRFPDIPDIEFTVSPVHESLQDIVSPAFFMTPPLDDYEHNTIHTNISDSSGNDLWSTLAHEGIPGHMYQFVYFLSNDPEPLRALLSFNGYQEGWATYVELMSYDYYEGYSEDCYADFERINTELSLLVSARVEIGANYEGWSPEDTATYLNENGFNKDAAEEIYNYVIAEPANYQMYILGWLEFKNMRAEAEEKLGDKFDEQEFHKILLDAGPCQFYLLRKLVSDYVLQNQ